MLALSHKSKQYGLLALKVLILSLTFGYIFTKIKGADGISFSQFTASINLESWPLFGLFISLALINWVFEIAKWQTLVSTVQRISFSEAAKQSLAALTVSLATPNRIGDYGAKAYLFPANLRKRVLLLNFFSNGIQMAVTCVLGVIGLTFTALKFNWAVSTKYVALGVVILGFFGIIGFFFKERSLLVKGLSISKVIGYFSNLPLTVKSKTSIYALLRYVSFTVLFYLLLKFFGAAIPFWDAIPILLSMYLMVSVVPTLFIFDVVVRGGVAVWLFSLAGIPEWPVLYTVFTMWLLNFVLPALVGSYYVIIHRRK